MCTIKCAIWVWALCHILGLCLKRKRKNMKTHKSHISEQNDLLRKNTDGFLKYWKGWNSLNRMKIDTNFYHNAKGTWTIPITVCFNVRACLHILLLAMARKELLKYCEKSCSCVISGPVVMHEIRTSHERHWYSRFSVYFSDKKVWIYI